MSRPVDVLATLDDAAMRVEAIHGPTAVYALREARAAVAELLEAARQASATLGHAYHTTLTGQLSEYAHTDYQRLDAALAKFGGAA